MWLWKLDFEREGYSQELGEILVLTCVRYNFSPTNHTNFTPLFSLKRLFSPRNARNTRNFIIYLPQITQIKMIFTIRIQRFALLLRKNRSTELHRFLPYGIFLDMKTREHDIFSRRLFSPTDCTELTFY